MEGRGEEKGEGATRPELPLPGFLFFHLAEEEEEGEGGREEEGGAALALSLLTQIRVHSSFFPLPLPTCFDSICFH